MDCHQAKELIDRRLHEEAGWPASFGGGGRPADAGSAKRAPDPSRDRKGAVAQEESTLPPAGTESRRVHLDAPSSPPTGSTAGTEQDWSDLDAHLATCERCSADLAELRRTRALVVDAANEKPGAQEIETMWTAIATAGLNGGSVAVTPGKHGWLWTFAAASVGIAAVLGIAFRLGAERNIHAVSGLSRARTAAELPANVPASSMPRSGEYDADGWGIPVHPRQYADSSGRKVGKGITPPAYVGAYSWHGAAGTEESVAKAGSVYTPMSLDSVNAGSAVDLTPPDIRYAFASNSGDDSSGGQFVDANTDGAVDADGTAGDARMITVGRVPADAIATLIDRLKKDPSARSRRGSVRSASKKKTKTLDEQQVGQTIFGGGSGLGGYSTTAQEDSSSAPASAQPQARSATKIIKTGHLTAEVASYNEAVARVESVVKQHDAAMADASTHEQAGGALAGSFVIRVAPERFEALFAALKGLGRVESENVKAADVTAAYVDLEARITGLEITEKRLQELISNKSFVDKISSLLEVEREMTRVRSQIEQLMGELRVMADRVAQSTIHLTLHEPSRTVPSATLSVEVAVLGEAAAVLGDVLEQFDGRLTSGSTAKHTSGSLVGSYQLQVNLSRFAELLGAVESLGRVENRQVSDQQFGEASSAWAASVPCNVALSLYERTRELPSGSMSIEVDELGASIERLTSTLEAAGGSIVSNQTTRQDDGSSAAAINVRVPAGRFGELAEALALLGRTTAKNVSGEAGRIVGGAAETLCQLSLRLSERPREVPSGRMLVEVAAFDPARDQLSKLVAEYDVQVLESSSHQRSDESWSGGFRLGIKAGDLDKVIARFGSLGRVLMRQIEGAGLGDLSRAHPDAMGVVSLTLAEKSAIGPGPERAGETIRKRLRDGLAGLYSSLGFIAYGLIVMAPWLVMVAVLAAVATRVWHRRKKRAAV